MKKVIAVLFFLVLNTSWLFSKPSDTFVSKFHPRFVIDLPKYKPREIQFYDFKYQMKDQYYFKGDMVNWSQIRLKGQFIVPTKWGNIFINIYLPPISPSGIFSL